MCFYSKMHYQVLHVHNTPVYTCFLNASKVHRLIHWIWGGSTGRLFTISNGLRQGGTLSPKLFSLYMTGLTDDYLIAMLGVTSMISVLIILCRQIIFSSCHLLALQCRICLMSPTILELYMIFYLILWNLSVWYISLNVTNWFVIR